MTESTFRLSVFVLACKKSGYFICSVLRNRQFYSSKTRLATPIFDHPQSASTLKEISLFHLFILQIESILESHHMTGHIHFWPHQPQNFQCPFNLHEFVPACKKSVNSWDTVNLRVQRPDLLNLLWRNSSFRNYTIGLAESILAYISGIRFFPNIRFVQEHSK